MANTIDEYLALVPEQDRVVLQELRQAIRAAAPMATETISYRIPCFTWHGPLVFFAAFRDHLSLFVMNKAILESFKSELKPYHTSGTTIHFSAAHPLPKTLVTAIVQARINDNMTKRNN